MEDRSGNIFVGSEEIDPFGGTSRVLIRKSGDRGTTWSTSENYVYSPGLSNNFNNLFCDTLNNMYEFSTGLSGSNTHSIVRRSANNGGTWSTSDDYIYPGGTASALSGAIEVNGVVYVSGTATDSSANVHWIVRKTTDHGGSWQMSDDFVYPSSTSNSPTANLVADASNNLYLIGNSTVGGVNHWIVRRTSNNGMSWVTVDDFIYGGNSASASSILINSKGNFLVVGTAPDISGAIHLIVRGSKDIGANWQSSDDFLYRSGSSVTTAGLFEANGSIYSTGSYSDGTVTHWITRRIDGL